MATDGMWVKDGSTWRRTTPYVKDGTVWRKCQKVWVKSGSTWQMVWQDRAPQTVSTFDATDSATWRTDHDIWRTDNDTVYQGSWSGYGNYYGLYFHNSASIRSVLQADGGRVIDRFRIYLKREAAGHGYHSAQNLYAWMHNYTSQPGSAPSLYEGPYFVGSFALGDAKWVDLPKGWAEKLRDNTRHGIGFYNGSSPYLKMEGQNVASSRGRLEITHS